MIRRTMAALVITLLARTRLLVPLNQHILLIRHLHRQVPEGVVEALPASHPAPLKQIVSGFKAVVQAAVTAIMKVVIILIPQCHLVLPANGGIVRQVLANRSVRLLTLHILHTLPTVVTAVIMFADQASHQAVVHQIAEGVEAQLIPRIRPLLTLHRHHIRRYHHAHLANTGMETGV